jgi:transposase
MSMNPFLSKLMTYYEVHKLSREGFSIRKISARLGLNWRTVKRMLTIEDDRDYERYLQTFAQKDKLLEPYTDFVRNRLEQFRDTSAAQMHDWLKEHYPDFPKVSGSTVFNFVHWIRQQHNLPQTAALRSYELVEETPYGSQAQVDFGAYSLRTGRGTRIKVYFFALVLSRSRYKYVYFSLQPFTSHTAIEAHEKAFAFIGGIPDTLVYDQDRVFMVDENKGDLLLTAAFRNYSAHRGFKLHFCRKADPQSKGKVENVVKYTKQNFLYNRTFLDIDLLNSEALAWLHRTANELPHSFTQKRPVAEWGIERDFLQVTFPMHIPAPKAEPYTVRKDNSVSFKGNLYSLPYDSYKGRGTKVEVKQQDGQLVILTPAGQELCRHTICTGVGQKIINNDHRRDKN